MFRNLFKAGNGIKNVITVFHSAQQPQSMRLVALLKQHQGNATATATMDQGSSHPVEPKTDTANYELQFEEGRPTSEQLTSILEYIGNDKASRVVDDATSHEDALKKLEQGSSLKLPLTVDWNNGRVVSGDNESEILKLLKESQQQ